MKWWGWIGWGMLCVYGIRAIGALLGGVRKDFCAGFFRPHDRLSTIAVIVALLGLAIIAGAQP